MWWSHVLGVKKNWQYWRLYWQEFISFRKKLDESNNVNDSSDVPGTPCFKSATRSFVVARSNYSGLPDFSPMVDALGDLADEDTWAKLNKGFVPDLDKLQFTPAFRSQPIPLNTATMVSRYIYFKIEWIETSGCIWSKQLSFLFSLWF